MRINSANPRDRAQGHDAIRKGDLFGAVRRHQDRRIGQCCPDAPKHTGRQRSVQPFRRLVQQQKFGPAQKRPRQNQTPPLSARQPCAPEPKPGVQPTFVFYSFSKPNSVKDRPKLRIRGI